MPYVCFGWKADLRAEFALIGLHAALPATKVAEVQSPEKLNSAPAGGADTIT